MRLDSYRCLIANLPVRQQAFTSKLETWMDRVHPLPDALAGIFSANQTTTISRSDLFWMSVANDLPRFVFAVILWGYPNGMRGNHFPNLVNTMPRLETMLTGIRNNGNLIPDWDQHWNAAFAHANDHRRIEGLKLSTYSKILYFMNTRANGTACLILDRVLIDVFSSHKFDEFEQLTAITYASAPSLYPTYLDSMEREALRLGVSPDQLEMFLFMFGPILK